MVLVVVVALGCHGWSAIVAAVVQGCESAGTGKSRHCARAAAVTSIRGQSRPHNQLSVIEEEGDAQPRKVALLQ
jgi:hypothetical protein